jgi:hypothetical protein
MTELEKLKNFTELLTNIFQHTPLKAVPTWCACSEGDDYCAENYHIAWQNDDVLAEINLTFSEEKNRHMFMMFITTSDNWTNKECEIEDLLKYPANQDLLDFIEYINNNF